MSTFSNEWAAAKTKFENDTDAKKPVQKGKLLFISYRKSTKIEGALESLDKLCPGPINLQTATSDVLAKAVPLVDDLKKKTDAYRKELDDAIKTEKPNKDNSETYRSLKILRATLDKIVSEVEHDLGVGNAAQYAKKMAYEGSASAAYKALQPIRTAIDSNCKKGIAVAQGLLANPTPQAFNDAFPKAARDITQPVGNLYKYSFPDELTGRSKETVEAHLNADPRLLLKCLDLKKASVQVKTFLEDFAKPSGNDCTDANLWKMANSGPTLAADADPITVKKAIKNYLLQIKEAQKLVEILRSAGV